MSERVNTWPSDRRADLAERKAARLLAVAVEARDIIREDRAALFDAHKDCHTGEVTDRLGRQALAEYDAVIARLDAAIAGAMEA